VGVFLNIFFFGLFLHFKPAYIIKPEQKHHNTFYQIQNHPNTNINRLLQEVNILNINVYLNFTFCTSYSTNVYGLIKNWCNTLECLQNMTLT